MKKVIILFFVILLCGCSAEKPAKTMSNMQTEPTVSETTVAETAAPEETTESISEKTETVIEIPKEETIAPSIDEKPKHKPTPETTTVTTEKTTVEPVKTETTTVLLTPPKMPIETSQQDKPKEIPKTVETPSESVTEPPKAEFDVNYWIDFARSYALQIGLEIDPTAVDCWDNPTIANADCIYLERDLKSRLNRYASDGDITAVNIWAENLGNGNYLIYIAYA